MHTVTTVNPFNCRMWQLHHRLEDHITEETCRAEITSFAEHGQLVPVLGRSLRQDSEHEIELIYGARRLFVARHVNKPLVVQLREISDREAIIAMDLENRQRRDISPYERGASYARWLQAGYFKSQDDIARALKISPSQVSRLLKLACLPKVIIDAFHSEIEIRETWALQLAEAMANPDSHALTVEAANSMAAMTPRLDAQDVYRQLLAVATRPRRSAVIVDKVIKDRDGAPLFEIKYQNNSINIVLPIERVSAKGLDSIKAVVRNILQDSTRGSTSEADETVSLLRPASL